ncbi:hypothetical protein JAAARDRAFT_322500 [Jaapia argillacea MUCL 33604]|uniref:Uncharacterized protein n=1 Tax=Jaapia argillacea MUCL 33604 TaxID=933084 RepID=A0A067Q0Q6_9AGAM|nr:hypothetical protein JAAARDRAFT_322500 [Jaapia argillacea MUCL 33604]
MKAPYRRIAAPSPSVFNCVRFLDAFSTYLFLFNSVWFGFLLASPLLYIGPSVICSITYLRFVGILVFPVRT